MFEQLTLFSINIGQKIEYISCGKKYKGTVNGYRGSNYIVCTTNQRGFSGVSLHVANKDKNWFVK